MGPFLFILFHITCPTPSGLVFIPGFCLVPSGCSTLVCPEAASCERFLCLVDFLFDGWIFENFTEQYDPLAFNLRKEHFKMYELKEIMRHKESKQFADVLNRIRNCNHTSVDIKLLL
jgi:hypothetical protein